MPKVRLEYDAHMETLKNNTFDKSTFESDCTTWGRKKGGLVTTGRCEEADEVAKIVARSKKFLQFLDASQSFLEVRDAQRANKVAVTREQLDSSIGGIIPDHMSVTHRVAQATLDAQGRQMVSACTRLMQIPDTDCGTEFRTFWRKHFQVAMSRADARGTRPEDLREDIRKYFQPVYYATSTGSLTIPADSKKDFEIIYAILAPGDVDEETLKEALNNFNSDGGTDIVDVGRAFRVYESGQASLFVLCVSMRLYKTITNNSNRIPGNHRVGSCNLQELC